MAGWVKLHRSILSDPVWFSATAEQKAVLISILLLADHKPQQWIWHGQKFETIPGQFITSLNSLADKAGVSLQNVRSAITRFEKLNFLTNQSTKTGRLISIINWDSYQSVCDLPNKEPNRGPTKPQQLTRSKEVKNETICANEESFELFWDVFADKRGKAPALKAWNKIKLDDVLLQRILNGAKAYAELRPKMLTNNQTPKMAQGWLTDERWTDETVKPVRDIYQQSPQGFM